MQFKLEIVVPIILAVWIFVLTGIYYWFYSKIIRPFRNTKTGDLIEAISKLIEIEKTNSKSIKDIRMDLEKFHDESKLFVQKVGLVRFNPFDETGGDHSFSLALLNAKETGVVITGLHTRERTRLYLKPITKGKSEHELSKEEKEAIEKAKKEA